jgi:SAM-dependent methyltransferase
MVREFAARVGPTGRAVGLDRSATLLRTARERAVGLPQVEFVQGDAHRLDFEDGSFDACQAERVFMYLADPEAAFAELVRVARPGARIVVFDPDMEGWMIDSRDRALTRRILNYWCDGVPNGWMGRRWPGLFHQFGLEDLTIEPMTLLLDDFAILRDSFRLGQTLRRGVDEGAFTSAEIEPWMNHLEARARGGRFLFAATNFLVAGRKP